MRVLVTGRQGQVATALAERLDANLVWAARPDFDLADSVSIERFVAETAPDLIISAAAYTAVDKAEDEPELAMAINGAAPGVLARAAARCGASIIHLSTDYVFDGSGERPWREEDAVGPLGIYGATKLAGERAIATESAPHAILRTAWVYSPFGNNFVKTMLRLAEGRDLITVVDDQIGCPTSALDIADAIAAVVRKWQTEGPGSAQGIYHIAGSGSASWADLAREVFRLSRKRGGPFAEVQGISTAQYPTRATRPANSRLDCARFEMDFGFAFPGWQESLTRVIERLMPQAA